MSNQRSFKIGSFRFAAFVPKKIEYIRFWNKILDRNKTFLFSTRIFLSKSFVLVRFQNFFWTTKSLVLSLRNPGAIWNVLVSFWYHFFKNKKVLFCSWVIWNKQKRSKLIFEKLEIVPKSSVLFPLKPRYMETFRYDNKLMRFRSGFVF